MECLFAPTVGTLQYLTLSAPQAHVATHCTQSTAPLTKPCSWTPSRAPTPSRLWMPPPGPSSLQQPASWAIPASLKTQSPQGASLSTHQGPFSYRPTTQFFCSTPRLCSQLLLFFSARVQVLVLKLSLCLLRRAAGPYFAAPSPRRLAHLLCSGTPLSSRATRWVIVAW